MHETIVSKILLATDFSASADLAQAYTEYLAVTLKASVIVLHDTQVEAATPSWLLRPAAPQAGRMENPALTIEIAKAGCISSQALTHRAQEMHR